MRILITNDDSINSSVLAPLAKWASAFGEVTVVVPKVEQSAKSHGIQIHNSFEIKKVDLLPGVEAYTVDSTPADCVRVAYSYLKKEFDLVISGINRGLNIGQDIIYSGTVAAIMEASYHNVCAVALSTEPATFDVALQQLDNVRDFFIKHDLFGKYKIYNVNIPLTVKGFKFTRQGGPYFSDEFIPEGNDMFRPTGHCIFEDSHNDELDTDATLHGYISVTPMVVDRTNLVVLKQLQNEAL